PHPPHPTAALKGLIRTPLEKAPHTEAYCLIAGLVARVELNSALKPVWTFLLEACWPIEVLGHPEIAQMLKDETLAAKLLGSGFIQFLINFFSSVHLMP